MQYQRENLKNFNPINFLEQNLRSDNEKECFDYLTTLYILKLVDVNFTYQGKNVMSFLDEKFSTGNANVLNFVRKCHNLGYIHQMNESNSLVNRELNKLNQNIFVKMDVYPKKIIAEYCKISERKWSCRIKSKTLIYADLDDPENFEEVIFSNIINSYDDKIALKIDGYYETSENHKNILYEYYIYTLADFMKIASDFDLDVTSSFIKSKMLELVRKVKKLGEIGIVHLNLHPNNIVIMPDSSLRIMNFSKSIFLGITKDTTNENYLEEKYSGFTFDGDKNFKNGLSLIDYSTDVYNIGCIMYCFYTKRNKYTDLLFVSGDFYEIKNSEIFKVEVNLNRQLKDLIIRTIYNLSSVRLTCKEVLAHSFFKDGEIDENLLFSVSNVSKDISSANVRNIMLKSRNLKYVDEFLDLHSKDNVIQNKGIEKSMRTYFGDTNSLSLFRNRYQILGNIKEENSSNFLNFDFDFIRYLKTRKIDGNIESLKYIAENKFIPIFYDDICEALIVKLRDEAKIPVGLLPECIRKLKTEFFSYEFEGNVLQKANDVILREYFEQLCNRNDNIKKNEIPEMAKNFRYITEIENLKTMKLNIEVEHNLYLNSETIDRELEQYTEDEKKMIQKMLGDNLIDSQFAEISQLLDNILNQK